MNEVECVLLGFWKKFARHIRNKTSEDRLNNVFFLILGLVNNVLFLMQKQPFTDEADYIISGILEDIISVCYTKRFDFTVRLNMPILGGTTMYPKYWTPFTPIGNLTHKFISCTQNLIWLTQRHEKNTDEMGEQQFVCGSEYNRMLKSEIETLLQLLTLYTDSTFRDLALKKMIDIDGSGEDFSHEMGWDQISLEYFDDMLR